MKGDIVFDKKLNIGLDFSVIDLVALFINFIALKVIKISFVELIIHGHNDRLSVLNEGLICVCPGFVVCLRCHADVKDRAGLKCGGIQDAGG